MPRRNSVESVGLNESPSKKEGKSTVPRKEAIKALKGLNESPSKKEGKCESSRFSGACGAASMKALPKRKGNLGLSTATVYRLKPQ